MTYERWDIVLLPFPFTNLRASKKRPALVISPKAYNSGLDILVMFLTSNLKSASRIGDYIIAEWQQAGLPKPSMTRMKFATIDNKLVIKKIANLTDKDRKAINENMREFFGI